MLKILPFFAILAVSCGTEKQPSPQAPETRTTQRKSVAAVRLSASEQPAAQNDIIQVRTLPTMAGAIASVRWGGKEFIDAFDHGRELQYAMHLNGDGECYNPTEAGADLDGDARNPSTSVLKALRIEGNVFESVTQMAFWKRVGQSAGFGCRTPIAVNTTNLSSYQVSKRVTVGSYGIRHVVRLQAAIEAPEAMSFFQLEAPTGYMPSEFTSFYAFNPADGAFTPLPAAFSEYTDKGVIVATADGSHAMGAWGPSLPGFSRSFASGYLGTPGQEGATAKWSTVYRKHAVPAGTLGFDTFLAVGSLEDVRTALRQLYMCVGEDGATTDLVAGLFREAFGRDATPADITAWTTAAAVHGCDFVRREIGGHVASIDRVFRLYTGRAASPADLDAWGTAIRAGVATYASFVREIQATHASIERIFAAYTGRSATAEDHRAWSGAILSGAQSYGDFVRRVQATPASIERIFAAYTGRSATAEDHRAWSGAILAGAQTYEAFVRQVQATPASIERIFAAYTGRSATAEDQRAWSGAILAGARTYEDFVREVQATPESVERIFAAYTGRSATAEDHRAWSSAILSGAQTYESFMREVQATPASIDRIFRAYLGRPSTIVDHDGWGPLMRAGSLSYAGFVRSIQSSDESIARLYLQFFGRVAGYADFRAWGDPIRDGRLSYDATVQAMRDWRP